MPSYGPVRRQLLVLLLRSLACLACEEDGEEQEADEDDDEEDEDGDADSGLFDERLHRRARVEHKTEGPAQVRVSHLERMRSMIESLSGTMLTH